MSLSSAFAFLWPEPNATLTSRLPFAALVLMGYMALCSSLRFKRVESMQKRLGFQSRDSLSRMTNTQARDIVHSAASYEFPLFYDLALRVALFRTYTVDNIGKLLMSASDLNKQTTAAKRYEDTEVIFTCFFKFAPNSVHLHKAVARMNFLHQSYIKSGKILNKDLLYVLYA
ncbi:hypothetical protein VHEMI02070 [[Torrubiella] hemipterigena]|uniref:ER-bound oxygenase mpaB/mpaB'/Rubber oxygenase catalytic domain-containing protein n=1 Tax=[Torrubiella] hemipterigena TaxID=1531966 RepID=A0A0A1T9D1_9HYPO|nr:hypothetical protein VHEMI02070 [[Torrubiella] hemipterigena]